MPIHVHYEPNHKDFNAFAHSDQLRDAVRKAADDVVAYAVPESKTLAPDWQVNRGSDLVIGAFSRLTEEVVNENDVAAAIEFGTGFGRPGQTGYRPQGGYSFPHRILGKAGAKVGDMRGEPG